MTNDEAKSYKVILAQVINQLRHFEEAFPYACYQSFLKTE